MSSSHGLCALQAKVFARDPHKAEGHPGSRPMVSISTSFSISFSIDFSLFHLSVCHLSCHHVSHLCVCFFQRRYSAATCCAPVRRNCWTRMRTSLARRGPRIVCRTCRRRSSHAATRYLAATMRIPRRSVRCFMCASSCQEWG